MAFTPAQRRELRRALVADLLEREILRVEDTVRDLLPMIIGPKPLKKTRLADVLTKYRITRQALRDGVDTQATGRKTQLDDELTDIDGANTEVGAL